MDVEVRIRALEEQMAEMRVEVRRDGDHITQILAAIVNTQNIMQARFEQIDRRFEQVDRRFEQVDRRFDALQAAMSEGFSRIEARLENIENKINQ